jgi:flagellar biosynthesis protein
VPKLRLPFRSESRTAAKPKPRTQAVAVRHESGELPVVVAKGSGAIAERILEIAFATGVKVREDADLVQILNAVDLDSPIPAECFAAIAEILSYIYQVNRAAGDTPPL